MYLKELKLSSFKNCKSAELSLSEKINCFVGTRFSRGYYDILRYKGRLFPFGCIIYQHNYKAFPICVKQHHYGNGEKC